MKLLDFPFDSPGSLHFPLEESLEGSRRLLDRRRDVLGFFVIPSSDGRAHAGPGQPLQPAREACLEAPPLLSRALQLRQETGFRGPRVRQLELALMERLPLPSD